MEDEKEQIPINQVKKKTKKKRKRKKQNQIFLIKMLQSQANNGQMIYSLQITIQS